MMKWTLFKKCVHMYTEATDGLAHSMLKYLKPHIYDKAIGVTSRTCRILPLAIAGAFTLTFISSTNEETLEAASDSIVSNQVSIAPSLIENEVSTDISSYENQTYANNASVEEETNENLTSVENETNTTLSSTENETSTDFSSAEDEINQDIHSYEADTPTYYNISEYEYDLLVLAVQHETGHGVFDNITQQCMAKVFLTQYVDPSFNNSSLYETLGDSVQFGTLLSEIEYIKYCYDVGWDLDSAGVVNASLYDLYDQQTRSNIEIVLNHEDNLPNDLCIECCSSNADITTAQNEFYARFPGAPCVEIYSITPRITTYYDEFGNPDIYICNYIMFGTSTYGAYAAPY